MIVGGGIAGLAAAYRLGELSREREMPIRCTLLEAGPRLGGVIATEKRDGFLLELGPDSLLSEKPWALALCRRLGLESELIGTRDEHRVTFVVHRGRLEPLPQGFMLLAPTRLAPLLRSRLFSWPGKLRMACELLLPRGPARPDESLAAFVRRRLGREVLERVAQPLVGGIYTADPERLSLAATMPRFLQLEREHRSIIAALWRASRAAQDTKGTSGARWSLFVTLREGMQQFVDTLAARLLSVTVRYGCAVTGVRRASDGWLVECEDGSVWQADGVILATPAFRTAQIVQGVDGQLADRLATISYSSAATVNLAYRREQVHHPLNGFGFVVPHIEQRAIIAGSFSSVKYAGRAPEGFVLLRAFVGGALQEDLYALDDEDMEGIVRREFAQLLGVRGEPLFVRIARYPRSMPQYLVGHLELVSEIEKRVTRHPGMALAGNAYRGVGMADCVRSGEAAAEAVFAHLWAVHARCDLSSLSAR
ncbi:MAG: protoporphyrinogen oxidase [Candidatus Binatia bacterium]|nr:protoporphyrinogen oxidase [Candidatus Binatia bacterium]